MSDRTPYARAVAGYDEAHERALADAIMAAIAEASHVSDCNALVLRTGECASALLTVLASILAMSPSAIRSLTAQRRTLDELGKRLRRRVAAAESNPDVQDFLRRIFRTGQAGGNA
jgi:hypothetical protein